MGKVWLLAKPLNATPDAVYRLRLAVKTFKPSMSIELVERELNNWIGLEHIAILPLIKIGSLNDDLAAIMPIRRCNLEEVVEERVALKEEDAVSVLMNVSQGLSYAWRSSGLLHLDLKPSNILLEGEGIEHPQVADWGISRLTCTDVMPPTDLSVGKGLIRPAQLTQYAVGTPIYMSPERLSGRWELACSADIYSLGMMAVQLVTGVLPFRFDEHSPLEEVRSESYIRNAEIVLGKVSSRYKQFCLACIHPSPKRRISDYDAIISMLQEMG